MYLPKETFQTVISSAPLISIDLVVRNKQEQHLLGYRTNKPAQGYWFVPGGRILKDEPIEKAFSRIVFNEIGIEPDIENAKFNGVFEHFYNDYVFGNDVTTHYVVLAYQIDADIDLSELPNEQHSQYKWFSAEELLDSEVVHKHSKWYLDKTY